MPQTELFLIFVHKLECYREGGSDKHPRDLCGVRENWQKVALRHK